MAKKRKISNKRKLTRRMRRLVMQISFGGLLGIILVIIGMSQITSEYSKIVNEDYQNIQYINAIKDNLYQHQTVLLEHISASTDERKKELVKRAEVLEVNLHETLKAFGEDVKKHSNYESYYHNIYSGIGGYLKNVMIILDFSDKKQIATANYYMENALSNYIRTVNENITTLDELSKNNMERARIKLNRNSTLLGTISFLILLFIIVGAISTHFTYSNIANQMVNLDSITGISNLDKFLEEGEKKQKKGLLPQYAVLAMNIKACQYLISQVGTENADTMLCEYAKLISKQIKEEELFARINGDNFVALKEKSEVEAFLQKIQSIPVEVITDKEPKVVQVSTRCGIYEIEENMLTIAEMISCANLAEKMARKSSESDFIWYTIEMSANDMKEKYVLSNFHKALENKEFLVYYQPKVNMQSGVLCGAEALVRWQHNGKMVPPMDFIPVLEEEGHVVELDFYVLNQVCEDIAEWIRKGLKTVRVSSNFSKLHLHNEAFAERVLKIVHEHEIDSKYIEAELTETSGVEDFEAMTKFVNDMHKEGIYTAIDDFGTGYSSLSMLKDTAVDVVKLDRSFLTSVKDGKEVNQTNEKMVENIVRMILDLDRQVICEGVETKEQVEFLQKIQCYMAQGFYYDKPLSHDEFEEKWLRQ